MERLAIKDMVLSRIDEISSSSNTIVDVGVIDNKPLDTMIDSILDECACQVLSVAPVKMLSVESSSGTEQTVGAAGELECDADFLRFVSVKLDSWTRSVTHLTDINESAYKRQSNKYTAAGNDKPIAVLIKKAEKCYIKCYPSKEADKVAEFSWVKKNKAEGLDDSRLIEALAWLAASKVLAIMKDSTAVKIAEDNVKGLLI